MVKTMLQEMNVPFRYIDVVEDQAGGGTAAEDYGMTTAPTLVFDDGTTFQGLPSKGQLFSLLRVVQSHES